MSCTVCGALVVFHSDMKTEVPSLNFVMHEALYVLMEHNEKQKCIYNSNLIFILHQNCPILAMKTCFDSSQGGIQNSFARAVI